MKFVVQRVNKASVSVDDDFISSISDGYIVYMGIAKGDTEDKAEKLCKKLLKIRLFEKESVVEKDYEILCISQFTLFTKFKGRKPDFHDAEETEKARIMYNKICENLEANYKKEKIKRGAFGKRMTIEQLGNGPFTIILEE
ncbi:D-tyrosyl-tRNA deacylase 1 [Spraguea lophii 42_110]|uniref:D-aminoacyl-tRNA deacylase n=1 Tax=Spraguea lophii (strain 42_110) TaxID=1358809 RepID=S7XR82_SPRLO|nr:D-tyrosyl-tRNA deacylase 1 [Spraguea lophii 42_110]